MDDKKRIAKGIKLNASQSPLKKTGDFVLGGETRKVLSNKILDNLNASSNGSYFSSAEAGNYKAWSVSREFERPSSAEESNAQMKMIEGAGSAGALQNDNYDPFYIAEPNRAQDNDPFFIGSQQAEDIDQADTIKMPAAEAPQPASAQPQALVDAAPSAWGAPVTESGAPAVIKHTEAAAVSPVQSTPPSSSPVEDSPWSGPVTPVQPPASEALSMASPVESSSEGADPNDGWTFADEIPSSDFGDTSDFKRPQDPPFMPDPDLAEIPPQDPPFTPDPDSAEIPPQDPPFMPDPDSSRIPLQQFQLTPQMTADEIPAQDLSPAAPQVVSVNPQSKDKVESQLLPSWMSDLPTASDNAGSVDEPPAVLPEPQNLEPITIKAQSETFLNSIPNEEFMVDNDTLRNLFKSLVEPKNQPASLKPASKKTAEEAIAAAARILSSEVEIDLIPFEEIETAAVLELDAAASRAQQQQAQRGANVTRTVRGTIELATHANGRTITPRYNQVGMLLSVESSDGFRLTLTDKKDVWEMLDASGRTIQSGISGVAFDKQGNLSYNTKSGDVVTWKTDGTIDTKFKGKPAEPKSDEVKVEDALPAEPKSDEGKVEDAEPTETKSDEGKVVDAQPAEPKSNGGKVEDLQPLESTDVLEEQPSEPDAADKNPDDQQSASTPTKQVKASDGKSKSKPAGKSKSKKKRR